MKNKLTVVCKILLKTVKYIIAIKKVWLNIIYVKESVLKIIV